MIFFIMTSLAYLSGLIFFPSSFSVFHLVIAIGTRYFSSMFFKFWPFPNNGG